MEFDFEKAKAKIAEFCDPLPACIICQNIDWLWMEKTWELTEFRSGGKVLPVVALMCDDCGHTIFFNTVALGIMEKSAKE